MENYYKGKNVEEPFDKKKILIPCLPPDFIWMHVNGGSKMRNLLGYAMKSFPEKKAIVWSGSGGALSKTISCAEIMKRHFRTVHQINRICYRRVEEHWEPQIKDLDPLVVVREVPTIHILLSEAPLDAKDPGYQSPLGTNNSVESTVDEKVTEPKSNSRPRQKTRPLVSLGQFTPKETKSPKKRKGSKMKSTLQSSQNESVSQTNDENGVLDESK